MAMLDGLGPLSDPFYDAILACTSPRGTYGKGSLTLSATVLSFAIGDTVTHRNRLFFALRAHGKVITDASPDCDSLNWIEMPLETDLEVLLHDDMSAAHGDMRFRTVAGKQYVTAGTGYLNPVVVTGDYATSSDNTYMCLQNQFGRIYDVCTRTMCGTGCTGVLAVPAVADGTGNFIIGNMIHPLINEGGVCVTVWMNGVGNQSLAATAKFIWTTSCFPKLSQNVYYDYRVFVRGPWVAVSIDNTLVTLICDDKIAALAPTLTSMFAQTGNRDAGLALGVERVNRITVWGLA